MTPKEQLQQAIAKALSIEPTEVNLERAPSFTGADFAMAAKGDKALDAEEIKKRLEKSALISRVETKGIFVNFFISEARLQKELRAVLRQGERYGANTMGRGKTIIIDYSGPNIAKRFGIGHLRSTVIGQALYNLYNFLGYNAIGDNHLGDWGTQFGMIIAQVIKRNRDPRNVSIDELERLYVEFNQAMEKNPDLRDEAKEWFKKLEQGDRKARAIWQAVKETSLNEFDTIYALLDVHIDNAYGESFYERDMPAVVEELKEKKLLKTSKGAKVVELGEYASPALIIKSDGATTYLLRDLATIKFRLKKWNPHIIIYEVGSDQILHFRQLFTIVKLLGWEDDKEFIHVAHGLIRFQEGKMSTRKGQTVKLEDVLNEAIKRARAIVEHSLTSRGLDEKEKGEIAKAVGIGAIKYFDLSHHPSSDIIFDWEKLFMLEGNSAPYLQYTYARTQSVLTKAGRNDKKDIPFLTAVKNGISKVDEQELMVLRTLVHFPDVVFSAAQRYSPNLLCNFLFDVAQAYNTFYNQHRIIDSDNQEFRLTLTAAVGHVLRNGLNLLGIKVVKRM